MCPRPGTWGLGGHVASGSPADSSNIRVTSGPKRGPRSRVRLLLKPRRTQRIPVSWVPEGSLAGIFGSVFGVWAALGALKPFKNVGGRSPPHFWMVLKPSGAAQTPNSYPKKSGQPAFRYQCPVPNLAPGYPRVPGIPGSLVNADLGHARSRVYPGPSNPIDL